MGDIPVGKVVLAGGSGALGRRLAGSLAGHGWDVAVLTRRPRPDSATRQVTWDGRTIGPWVAELEGAVVVNLAGQLVDCRPTPANIERLRTSRVEPTQILREAATTLKRPPPLWIQMSTTAIYGDGGDTVLDESSAPVTPLPQMTGVAQPWETAADAARADRILVLRTSVVLDRDTPALDRLSGVVRRYLGGRIGAGRQWFSWIHIKDFVAIVDFVMADTSFDGIVHATSPNPVRNRELMAELRSVLGRPAAPPTPALFVRAGALLMRSDPALALTGRRVVPKRLLAAGFEFEHPVLPEALRSLLGPDIRPDDGNTGRTA